MYRNSYQRGMLTVFFSVGSKPLNIWETHTQDGYITRFLDQDIKSMVLEIGGTNVSTTYMTCPKGNTVLGITMPFLVMIVKNLKKYFTFEVTILDETGTRRRFRVSNFQSSTQILPLCTVMPIGLSDGWNQIQFNLAEFTRRAYKKQFVEVQKLKINANIRLRRIYFTERLIPEDQLPAEYKLFFPLANKSGKGKKGSAADVKDIKDDENIQKPPPQNVVEGNNENLDMPENVKKSGSEFQKPRSKTSVHSIIKPPSVQISKKSIGAVPDGETIPGSKRTSVAILPVATEDIGEELRDGEIIAEDENDITSTASTTKTTPNQDISGTEPRGEDVPSTEPPEDNVPSTDPPEENVPSIDPPEENVPSTDLPEEVITDPKTEPNATAEVI